MSNGKTLPHGGKSALTMGALGVVYGDIGTSPLYTMHEIFAGAHHPVPLAPDNVLGILSLIFWSLMLVVTLKYVYFIVRADNHGEGGVMALMALVLHNPGKPIRYRNIIILFGLFGAALFYGDSAITPAISVLSAVEGLALALPPSAPFIIPIAVVILVGLFAVQRRGTAMVGKWFGPVMLCWFITLGTLGVINIAAEPGVIWALNPMYAFNFIFGNPMISFFALGSVVLVVTGAEALYADMGHFGRGPIRLVWIGLVLPSLVLNYFGQGALILHDPKAIENPFYLLAPEWALFPLVILATVAAIIASQAVITGAFSVTQQAIQLDYLPRLLVQHTSANRVGQIYLPSVNWILLAAVVSLVIGFGSATNLASAYGIAVTGTMLITNLLAFCVAVSIWKWSPVRAFFGVLPFVIIDITFFAANSVKIADGGWFPIVFGLSIFLLLVTWKRGRRLFRKRLDQDALDIVAFAQGCDAGSFPRIQGTAVFLTSNLISVPHALLHSLKHFKSLHENVVLASVSVLGVPRVPDEDRVTVERLTNNFWRVNVRYGFMDTVDLPLALQQCAQHGITFDMMDTSFFMGRATLVAGKGSEMPLWRQKLFIAMFRNASNAGNYFRLPPNRIVELGAQVVL
jgi:KUP system potassium uptake protein